MVETDHQISLTGQEHDNREDIAYVDYIAIAGCINAAEWSCSAWKSPATSPVAIDWLGGREGGRKGREGWVEERERWVNKMGGVCFVSSSLLDTWARISLFSF